MVNLVNYHQFDPCKLDYISESIVAKTKMCSVLGYYCCLNGSIIGWIIYSRKANNDCEVLELFVLSKYRRNGIGSQLLYLISKEGKECKSISAKIRVYEQTKYLLMFFEKNLFREIKHDCSGFIIKRSLWENIFIHWLQRRTATKIDVRVVNFNKLTQDDLSEIMRIEYNYNVPKYLSFYQTMSGNEIRLLFKNENSQIIGWCVACINKRCSLDLKSTYVVNKYRNNQYVFHFWKCIYDFVRIHEYDVKWIIFHFDNCHTKLANFYRRFFSKSNVIEFNHVIVTKNVFPIL